MPLLQVGGKPVSATRILRSLQGRVLDRLQPVNAFRGMYRSFGEAQRAAPRTKPLGYDLADSADWYLAKLTGVQLEDYPVLFWLRSAFGDANTLLEIGGHIGVAYYGFSTRLQYPPGLSWTIHDVPTIAAAGAKLAHERGRSDIRFTSDLATAEGADILLAAGALQYLDFPNPGDIITNLRTRPRHVLVNITPVHDGPAFVTLQNIGSVYCPYRVFNRAELVASLTGLGYELVDSWQKPREFRLRMHPECAFDHYSGFYFRQRHA